MGKLVKMKPCGLTSEVSARGIQFIIHASFIHGVTSVVFCGILAIKITKKRKLQIKIQIK